MHLVVSRDGTVLAATGGAPASWVGARLDECADVPKDVQVTVVDALPLRRAPTDLRGLLRSALEVLQRQAKAFDVTLNVFIDSQVPALVSIDAGKIAWATTVLVGNALRYVHHGSRVMPGGAITVRVTCNPGGPEVAVEVQDDGSGIPADKLPLLFSAGSDPHRIGLGLAMVRDVVAAHGGQIDVHSETAAARRGTTVRFTLPVS